MTHAQLETTADNTVNMEEGSGTDGKLTLTEVPGDQTIDLSKVSASGNTAGVADVNLVGSDFVSTADFELTDGNPSGNDANLNLTATLTGGVNDITETPVSKLGDLDELILEDGATLNITAEQLEVLYTDNDDLTIADGANVTINVTDLSDQVLDLDTLVDENPGVNIGTITIADTNAAITIDGATTFGGADQIITPTADENDAPDGVEDTTLTMTVAQYLSSAGIVTGDALTNLTDLIHNNDSDGDVLVDNALVDTSGITAPTGTIGLGQLTVMLNENTDISGFEIELTNGQMIQFATEEQAAAEVTEIGTDAITAIGWKFDSVTGPVDTDGYDPDINTLYIKEDLVDGVNEESLWTFLPGTIKVEKVNDGLPDVLIGVDRVNTFQAFTSNDGVSFDDQEEFFTVANLTLNLEGNTDIGDIGLGDTVVPSGDPNNPDSAIFETLFINSYLDEESTQFPFGTPGSPGGITFQPNKIGDVVLNAGSTDEITNIEIRTFEQIGDLGSGPADSPVVGNQQSVDMNTGVASDGFTVLPGLNPTLFPGGGFFDMANVGDTNGHERDGLDIETGVLTFAANDPTVADLLVSGANDATIGGIDISDDEVTLLDVDASGHSGDLEIGTFGDFFDLNPYDHIYIADDHTSGDDDIEDTGTSALIVAGGDNDFTEEDDLSSITNVHVTGAGTTLTLTADQMVDIGITDTTPADGIADNWTIAPGASVTLNITEFDTQSLDLDAIAAAGFDIGTITTSDAGGEVASGTTFGMADAFDILVDTSDTTVEMTAEQYQTIENGNVGEQLTPNAVANNLVANIHVDELEGIEASPVDIDLSTVNVSGDQILAISEFDGPGTPITGGDGDVTLSDTSLLGDFAIRLWDVIDNDPFFGCR